MDNNINNIKEDIKKHIDDCDMLLVGTGSGFGKHPSIDTMQASIAEYKTEYEKICSGYYKETLDMYNKLNDILGKKNYFVIDTNIDGLIYKSQINSVRIVAPCGDIHRMQCGCNGEEGIRSSEELFASQKELICDVCHEPYKINVHGTEKYNEAGYLHQWNLYNKWLCGTLNKKLTILELGSDFKYASIIRWPFEKITLINEKATLIRVNETFPQSTPEIKDKTISVNEKCDIKFMDLLLD